MRRDIGKKVTAILFLAIIFVFMVMVFNDSAKQVYSLIKKNINKGVTKITSIVENEVNENFPYKLIWINMYGITQNAMFKNIVGDFEIIRDKNGYLHVESAEVSDASVNKNISDVINIYEHAKEHNIPFLFAQAPNDYISGKSELPYGLTNDSNKYMDILLDELDKREVPSLDVRDLYEDWPLENIMNKTDHHWKMFACFEAFSTIVEKINETYGLGIDPDWKIRNKENYKLVEYPNSFLGSRGIRVGRYYAGIDDFYIFYPEFETDLKFEHIKKNKVTISKEGPFETTLVNKKILSDPAYFNKYNAFLYGGNIENVIENRLMSGGKKCLIIGDSFNRSMAPYLSLCFSKTAFIDPQKGRFAGDYLAYMDAFQPDVVIVLVTGVYVF